MRISTPRLALTLCIHTLMRIRMLETHTKTKAAPFFFKSLAALQTRLTLFHLYPYSMVFDATSTRYCSQCNTRRPIHEFRKDTSSNLEPQQESVEPQQESEPNVRTEGMDQTERSLVKTCVACRERKRVSRNASRRAKKQRLNEEKWQKCSWARLCQSIDDGYHLGLNTIDV
jgi:hypothetical protein